MADFDFVDTDAARIYTAIIGSLMDSCHEALYPGDERRIFGEGLVSVFIALYSEFNDAMKQRTLRYARGEVLDALGERYDVYRLSSTHAHATFRFRASEAVDNNIIIPSGTRVTADGKIYFATEEAAVLAAGDLYTDVECVCTVGGSAINGLTPGTVSTLVDLIPFISGASNTTTTAGGDDGEPYTPAGDARFRERIRLAPAAMSTAGPESGYQFYAMSADPDIIDVSVEAPEDAPNTVNICCLLKGGALPDDETLQKVTDILADDVRPLTDHVVVQAPTTVSFGINIKYYCTADKEAETIEAIEGAGGAIDQYLAWQQSKLGRDVTPDQLRRFVLAPEHGTGALRVDVTAPVTAAVSSSQVAKLSGPITVTHEVVTG